MKLLVLGVMFLPVLAFCAAGIIELRASVSAAAKATRLLPIVLGTVAYGISWRPELALPAAVSSTFAFDKAATLFFSAIACSGAFISYSRRASAILIAVGSLFIEFLWVFLSHPTR